MEENLLRKQPPKPRLSISRNMVFCLGGVLAVSIVTSIATRKAPSTLKPSEFTESKVAPSQSLSILPSTYSEIPPEPTARTIVIERENSSPTQKDDSERRKWATDARRSSVQFVGLKIENSKTIPSLSSLSSNEGAIHGEQNSSNPRDEFNRQDDKINFVKGTRADDVYLHHQLDSPLSQYQIQAGTILPGVLLTALNSDLPGQILGHLSQNVFDTVSGRYLLVPQGTKVIGEYDSRIVFGQERLLIVWTRLIFPNGKSLVLEGMPGVDLSGRSGLSDQVNNHYLKLLTGVVFSSLLSASAQVADGRSYNNINPSYQELAIQGGARSLNDVGQEITRRNLSIQPTLEIRPGYRFNVFVHKDLVLEPYGKE
jgi:type IV secretory pathway VirB10-like protein